MIYFLERPLIIEYNNFIGTCQNYIEYKTNNKILEYNYFLNNTLVYNYYFMFTLIHTCIEESSILNISISVML